MHITINYVLKCADIFWHPRNMSLHDFPPLFWKRGCRKYSINYCNTGVIILTGARNLAEN